MDTKDTWNLDFVLKRRALSIGLKLSTIGRVYVNAKRERQKSQYDLSILLLTLEITIFMIHNC